MNIQNSMIHDTKISFSLIPTVLSSPPSNKKYLQYKMSQ